MCCELLQDCWCCLQQLRWCCGDSGDTGKAITTACCRIQLPRQMEFMVLVPACCQLMLMLLGSWMQIRGCWGAAAGELNNLQDAMQGQHTCTATQ